MPGRIILSTLMLALAPCFAPSLVWAQDMAEHAAHGAEKAGPALPHLDPTYFFSQLFWLFAAGGILYVLLARLALPRVATAIDRREHRIQDDLEQSYQLKHKAEDLKIAYTHALRDADEQAATIVDLAVRDVKTRQEQEMAVFASRVNDRIAQTEDALRAQKGEVLANLDAISRQLAQDVVRTLGKKAA